MDFIANNLVVILLMITGVGLVIVEMFLPGIGVPGIAGAVMLFIAIWLIWINYGRLSPDRRRHHIAPVRQERPSLQIKAVPPGQCEGSRA